jgi:hypothetical protein
MQPLKGDGMRVNYNSNFALYMENEGDDERTMMTSAPLIVMTVLSESREVKGPMRVVESNVPFFRSKFLRPVV